jgi:hypothetical protein
MMLQTIEIFKTNVDEAGHAKMLIDLIHHRFPCYRANFDLHDCDRILRIVSSLPDIDLNSIISLLKKLGFHAEVLPDEIPVREYTN